jgi:hypothetical protein
MSAHREAATSFARQAGVSGAATSAWRRPTAIHRLIFPTSGGGRRGRRSLGAAQGFDRRRARRTSPSTCRRPSALNNGGGLGFVFGSAGGAANLNLRLSAAENSGTIKTISSPRVVTVDNVDASISQGVSIPFSQTSAAGVTTSFIEARLELRVTPHVTQEGSIQMKIAATNNQPNPQLTGSNGQPSISRREARTEVLVRDARPGDRRHLHPPQLRGLNAGAGALEIRCSDGSSEEGGFRRPHQVCHHARIVNRSQSVVAAAPSAGDDGSGRRHGHEHPLVHRVGGGAPGGVVQHQQQNSSWWSPRWCSARPRPRSAGPSPLAPMTRVERDRLRRSISAKPRHDG